MTRSNPYPASVDVGTYAAGGRSQQKTGKAPRDAGSLYYAYYNFCRVHIMLRIAQARDAGLADRARDVQELLAGAQD